MRISEARQCLAEYQALLDLGEWTIACCWSLRGEIPPEEWAHCVWNTDTATALVTINRAAKLTNFEIRSTIVHELLHLAIQGHADHTGRRDPLFERALNRIATAILTR